MQSSSRSLRQAALQRSLQAERLDVTLPGRTPLRGRLHPVTQTLREIYRIFGEMGFQVYRSREVESDEYNFELLNIPAHHPARDMWDTFHTDTAPAAKSDLLRTHTSPGQIHAMREYAARTRIPAGAHHPARDVLPLRADQRPHGDPVQPGGRPGGRPGHHLRRPERHADRFRPPHVRPATCAPASAPRTSPSPSPAPRWTWSASCAAGKGCGCASGSGWLEILGCGMVHPVVLQNGGYDPQRYTGFAFGMGPERIAMLRYRIDDIRYFWANDLRFLEQF